MWALVVILMVASPWILMYVFAARAHARATRAGENSGAVGLAVRVWAYQQVLLPLAFLIVLFLITAMYIIGNSDRRSTAQSKPQVTKEDPPPGYQWGPNDSLRRIEKPQRAPRRVASQPTKELDTSKVPEEWGWPKEFRWPKELAQGRPAVSPEQPASAEK